MGAGAVGAGTTPQPGIVAQFQLVDAIFQPAIAQRNAWAQEHARDAVLNVPPTAVMGRGTDRAVYVVEGGVVHRRPIDVGITTWEAVEITRGLRAGDRDLLHDERARRVAVTDRPENGGR